MVRGTARTTGSAASGVNSMGQSADSGDRRPSRSLDVLDCSGDGRERDRQGQRQLRLETLGRLANLRSGIPNSVATQLASGWARQLSPELGDLDESIAKIEAAILPGIMHAPT